MLPFCDTRNHKKLISTIKSRSTSFYNSRYTSPRCYRICDQEASGRDDDCGLNLTHNVIMDIRPFQKDSHIAPIPPETSPTTTSTHPLPCISLPVSAPPPHTNKHDTTHHDPIRAQPNPRKKNDVAPHAVRAPPQNLIHNPSHVRNTYPPTPQSTKHTALPSGMTRKHHAACHRPTSAAATRAISICEDRRLHSALVFGTVREVQL